ncbi:MAG: sigma 54-interacting transcriptional regulator [Candidatus Cloacimonetes bacterium]|nr:sigma 54-interacting transcriptional regulator [Candidatus Cloacimonadota bacterium]
MKSQKIMIVEDDISIATDLRNSLISLGYHVITIVKSGEEALLNLKNIKPDLITMDIELEGKIDGIETAIIINKKDNIPIVFITAHVEKEIFEKAKSVLPYGFILKPLCESDLRATIELAFYKHNMELLLQEKDELFDTVINTSPNFIYVKDSFGKYIMVNKMMADVWNTEIENIVGKTDFQLRDLGILSEEKVKSFVKEDQKVISTKQPMFIPEKQVIFPNGKKLWVQIRKLPLTLKGNPNYVLGIVENITEQKNILELKAKFEETSKQLYETKKFNSLISSSLKDRIEMNFIGKSKKIKEVLDLAMTAANYRDANVLITGESGTGKEIIAHIIHYASSRKNKLFVPVNSSSVPESLAESEFFGHIEGAFTGASRDKIGFLERADQGTLFLDEIGDTPSVIQAKLLRVLEDKKITRIGSNEQIQVDFRIIAATNKNLDELITEKQFRMDLLYRLNTIEIKIPPLRERTSDFKQLLFFFVSQFSKSMNKPKPEIKPEVFEKLSSYYFPGNVRELKNMVEKAMILMTGTILEPKHFVTSGGNISNQVLHEEIQQTFNLSEIEKQTILAALERMNNNRNQVADALGISRVTLFRKLKNYNIG